MNVSAIPDYKRPIVGYRVWRWGEAELISLNGEPWLPGRPLGAGCRGACVGAEVPKMGCTCGVYAAKSFEHLIALFQYHGGVQYYGGVIGEVYLWGKVVEHDLPGAIRISQEPRLAGRYRLGTLPLGTPDSLRSGHFHRVW